MSYILDALKKSDKERRSKTPDLHSVQDIGVRLPDRRSLWPYLLLVALLLNVGVMAWWFLPSRPKTTTIPAQTAMTRYPDQVKAAVAAIALNVKKETPKPVSRIIDEVKGRELPAVRKQEAAAVMQEPAEIRQPQPANPVKADIPRTNDAEPPAPNRPPSMPKQDLTNVPHEPRIASTPPREDPARVENRIFNVGELPPAVQQGLPPLSISAHIHSGDPASRMVKINGKTMKEGQELMAGLKVEEITAGGVILSYHNYRFVVGLR